MKRLAVLGAIKLSEYIRQVFEETEYAEYTDILAQSMTVPQIRRTEEELFDEIGQAEESSLLRVLGKCRGNQVAITLLELCVLRYVNHEYAPLMEMVSPGNGKGVCLMTAARIAELVNDEIDCADPMYALKAAECLELWLMMSCQDIDMSRSVFCCDASLAAYLYGNVADSDIAGGEVLDRILRDDCVIYDGIGGEAYALYGYENDVRTLGEMIAASEKTGYEQTAVIISAEAGSGRCSHARAIEKGRRMLAAEYAFLTEENASRLRLMCILRICAMYELDLCIRNIVKDENTVDFVKNIMDRFAHHVGSGRIIMLTDENVKLIPYMKGTYFYHEIKRPEGDISKALWDGMLKDAGLSGYDTDELSSVLTMNAGQLKAVIGKMAAMEKACGGKIPRETIYRMCYEVLDDGRYENMKRVEPGYSLEDLKIDVRKKAVLREICNQVRYRNKVYEKWGMSEKYAYGRCVSILLAGPPGTGKTMAVHALAKELGLEMYKVDLSQIVDKYIGETEKRLEEVFTKAERSNMILFFDEADAVMGKRTDTSDAHDKNANTQIAFILQRMESYDGIVVLATNLMMNIDKAFMRRIRYVLQFEYPAAQVRYDIWRSAFARAVPVSPDVDFGFLAESFEISGAVIKNIVLNATFYAAADDTEVTMEHIMQAVFREEAKDHGIIGNADLSLYEYLR